MSTALTPMARRTGRIHLALCLAAVLRVTSVPVLAQVPFIISPTEPARHLKDGKVLHALRIAAESPVIDGSLADEAWTLAETAGDFLQRDPDNGSPMTEVTRVQVAYDDRFLYIAVMCDDGDATRIAAGLGRRDEFPSSDYVGFGFDPRHDHLTGYLIETNPSGVQRDYSITDDDRFDLDYNAVWEVRTQIGGGGWTAEFRVPFSQVRFTASPIPGQVWGMNARRQVRRTNELGTWVAKPRGERGEVSLFGHLVFDAPIAAPRRIEIVPYVLSRADLRPAGLASTAGASGGADLRIGLGQGATLSATVNPDFGQVEQDPAVLNLSVFETFFPEKRAFFLEDSRTFIPNGHWVATRAPGAGGVKTSEGGTTNYLRRLARPRSYEFEPVAAATNPDFNRKSLRGNVVLRWEYVRGSTLFVVWNLSQSDTSRPGDFRPFRDIGSAFGADANHTFMVKLTYWLNR